MTTAYSGRTQCPKVIPVTEWPQHFNWPPVGGLRHLIFTNKNQFRDKVVVRCGRRVLIDVDRFHAWLDETNGRMAASEGMSAP